MAVTPEQPPRASRQRRLWVLVWAVLGIVALSAVIFAVSALSAPRKTPTLPMARTGESQRLYNEALAALESGDTTKAASLLDRALEADPDNTAAKNKRVEIDKGKDGGGSAGIDPAGDGSADDGDGNGTTPPADDPPPVVPPVEDAAFGKAVADMGRLLPKAITGFAPGTPVVVSPDAELALDPAAGSKDASRLTRVQLSVHDRGSKDAAVRFLRDHMDTVYKKSRGSVAVAATAAPGTFGTDGGRLAALMFTRGRFAYEVVITSNGPDPATLKDTAKTVADAFPTKP